MLLSPPLSNHYIFEFSSPPEYDIVALPVAVNSAAETDPATKEPARAVSPDFLNCSLSLLVYV